MTKHDPVPSGFSKGSREDLCQKTHEINGNTVNFHVSCKDTDAQMDATGSMTYTGDSMEGHIKSHGVRAGKSMDSTVDITGQYLGPC